MEMNTRPVTVYCGLSQDYVEKLDADAARGERPRGRQLAYIVKAFYDGRLVWRDGRDAEGGAL